MNVGKSFLSELFKISLNDFEEKELIDEYEISFEYSGEPIEYKVVEQILNSADGDDQVFIKFDQSDVIKRDIDSKKLKDILDDTNDNLELGPIDVTINVSKKNKDYTSIYCCEVFFKYLDSFTFYSFFKYFNDLYGENKTNFKVINENAKLITNNIYISNCISNPAVNNGNYLRKLELSGKTNIDFKLNITPYDFKIKEATNNDFFDKTKKRFETIQYILSLLFISNQTYISNELYKFDINGYKNISIEYNKNIEEDIFVNDVIIDIFEWAFEDGNIVDKLGIVRNVLSINYKDDKFNNLSDTAYETIIGNYLLYLKNHVQDYLKLKENVTVKFQGYCDECADQISQLSSTIRKNFLALFGYLITVLLTKGITNSVSNIFSEEVAIITSFVLVGSFVVWVISLIYYKNQNEYIEEKIKKFKLYYKDIITDKELESLVKNNTLIDFARCSSKKQARTISIIWVVSLIILFLVLDVISGSTKLLFFINML